MDGRPNRRNNAAVSNSFDVVWTGHEFYHASYLCASKRNNTSNNKPKQVVRFDNKHHALSSDIESSRK